MTTEPDDQTDALDSVVPKATVPDQSVDQAPGSPNLPEVTVLERRRPGLHASALSDAIDSLLESDSRRYNAAQFLRIAGIWANDLHSRMEAMNATINELRGENARLMEQLTTKREEIATLRATEKTRAKHKPLIGAVLLGGPILVEIGLRLVAHDDLGLGTVVTIIGVAVVGAAVYVALGGRGSHD